jgi:hypothetical protein
VFSVDRKVFPLTRKYFPLTGKCFPLTNFPNGKQTQESLESGFPENEFQETNMALKNKIIFEHKVCAFFKTFLPHVPLYIHIFILKN